MSESIHHAVLPAVQPTMFSLLRLFLLPSWLFLSAWRGCNHICAPSPLQTFQANEDATEVVLNKIHSPVLTRFVRIRPQSWHNGIALRLELYGCRITGEGPLLYVPPTAPPRVLSPTCHGDTVSSMETPIPRDVLVGTGTQVTETKGKHPALMLL